MGSPETLRVSLGIDKPWQENGTMELKHLKTKVREDTRRVLFATAKFRRVTIGSIVDDLVKEWAERGCPYDKGAASDE